MPILVYHNALCNVINIFEQFQSLKCIEYFITLYECVFREHRKFSLPAVHHPLT